MPVTVEDIEHKLPPRLILEVLQRQAAKHHIRSAAHALRGEPEKAREASVSGEAISEVYRLLTNGAQWDAVEGPEGFVNLEGERARVRRLLRTVDYLQTEDEMEVQDAA